MASIEADGSLRVDRTGPTPTTARVTLAMHYRNGFRYSDQPKWFDFYNCRVVIPDQHLYFFAVPYVLSGPAVAADKRGLYVYDSGNGGPDSKSRVASEYLGDDCYTAEVAHCEFRWEKRDGSKHFFTEEHIRFTGPSTQWDIRLEPFLGDRQDPISRQRHYEFEEKMMLQQVPFIHRVPRMKAFAHGTIVQRRAHYTTREITAPLQPRITAGTIQTTGAGSMRTPSTKRMTLPLRLPG